MNNTPKEARRSEHRTGTAHHLNYVSGFVGVFGERVSATKLVLPCDELYRDKTLTSGPNYRVLGFGRTSPTLSDEMHDVEHVFVKGRPFFLKSPLDFGLSDGCRRATLANLDGRWALCGVAAHMLVCATDLLGAGPLYHCVRGHRFYFSTHLGALVATIGDRLRFDDVGIASYLLSRASIDGQTHLKGVSRLGASTQIVARLATDGRLRVDNEPYLNIEEELLGSRAPSCKTASNQLERILTESIEREFAVDGDGGRWGLMLSGGLDSKALGIVSRKHLLTPLRLVTFGERDSKDVIGARVTARGLGYPHQVVPYDWWDFKTYARRIIKLHGGMVGLQTSHILPGLETADQYCDTVLVGFLGDAITGQKLPANHEPGPHDLMRLLFSNLGFEKSLKDLYPGKSRQVKGKARILSEKHDNLAPMQAFLLLDWTIRQASWVTGFLDVGESFVQVATPFYSRSLLKLFFNLPPELLRKQKLYRTWIRAQWRSLWPEEVNYRPMLANKAAVARLNWSDRVRRNEDWFAEVIGAGCHDTRLRQLCVECLATASQTKKGSFPTLLLAIPLCLSNGYYLKQERDCTRVF